MKTIWRHAYTPTSMCMHVCMRACASIDITRGRPHIFTCAAKASSGAAPREENTRWGPPRHTAKHLAARSRLTESGPRLAADRHI